MPMGHNPRTITSANAVLMLRCKGIYDDYVTIQGFQANNAWEFGEVNIGETRIGVDGKQSIGYTPHETQWTLHLEANSSSTQILENIRKDFNSNMEARFIDIVVEIPSIGKRYSGTGALISMTGGASGKKLLDGTSYNFNVVTNGAEEIA
ncbi:phage tail fiber protein [Photorhabdus sp. RM71S]|uniref:phage tail fiber protein n=1 Tax=Photorhabdus sp. RM71S TaxID=3342824 RepID=UPI0036D81FCA